MLILILLLFLTTLLPLPLPLLLLLLLLRDYPSNWIPMPTINTKYLILYLLLLIIFCPLPFTSLLSSLSLSILSKLSSCFSHSLVCPFLHPPLPLPLFLSLSLPLFLPSPSINRE